MSGLIQRILSRRAAAPESQPTQAIAPGAEPAAAPAHDVDPAANGSAASTAPHDGQAVERPLPAGAEPDPVPSSPSFRERGKLRRRLRYLRRLRELLLRDLGGLVFDIHRFGDDGDPDARAHRAELVEAKVAELAVADRELRALERALDDRRPLDELRIAGVGGTCPHCGALHASDARFCSSCGAPVAGAAEPALPEAPEAPVVAGDSRPAPDGAPGDAGR
jgi:hypothetical protein